MSEIDPETERKAITTVQYLILVAGVLFLGVCLMQRAWLAAGCFLLVVVLIALGWRFRRR
jgi:hypothetical protein